MYEIKERVRFSEVDDDGYLTMLSTLNYFQDVSTFHSEDCGESIFKYKKDKQAWVINYWQIDLLKMPKFGTKITVGTIPYSFRGFLGYRNFYIKDTESGENLAVANSIWTLLDLETLKPVRASEEMMNNFGVGEKLSMDYADRKRITLSDNFKTEEKITVQRHHLDTNMHVNNGQYIQMALDYLPDDFKVKRLQAEYIKSARLSDVMVPKVSVNNDSVSVFLDDESNKSFARVMFS